jgi:hypothetical protein
LLKVALNTMAKKILDLWTWMLLHVQEYLRV